MVVVSEWVRRWGSSEMGRHGGDWQAMESEGEYWKFTRNETCQFECLKAKQWAGCGWRVRRPFLLREKYFRVISHPWPWSVSKQHCNHSNYYVVAWMLPLLSDCWSTNWCHENSKMTVFIFYLQALFVSKDDLMSVEKKIFRCITEGVSVQVEPHPECTFLVCLPDR